MVEALLTTEQAAAALGFKPDTLAHWRVSGGGPEFIKKGRAVRYAPGALAAWIERHTQAHTGEGRSA